MSKDMFFNRENPVIDQRTGNHAHVMDREANIARHGDPLPYDSETYYDGAIPHSKTLFKRGHWDDSSTRSMPTLSLNSKVMERLSTGDWGDEILNPVMSAVPGFFNSTTAFTIAVTSPFDNLAALEGIAMTMLVPPRNMDFDQGHSFVTNASTNGIVVCAATPEPLKINFSGVTPAMVTTLAGLSAYEVRKYSTVMMQMQALHIMFKTNGVNHATYERMFSHSLSGQVDGRIRGTRSQSVNVLDNVSLTFDGTVYLGHFNNFTLSESADQPYLFNYGFSFTVTGVFGDMYEGHIGNLKGNRDYGHIVMDHKTIQETQLSMRDYAPTINPETLGFSRADIMGVIESNMQVSTASTAYYAVDAPVSDGIPMSADTKEYLTKVAAAFSEGLLKEYLGNRYYPTILPIIQKLLAYSKQSGSGWDAVNWGELQVASAYRTVKEQLELRRGNVKKDLIEKTKESANQVQVLVPGGKGLTAERWVVEWRYDQFNPATAKPGMGPDYSRHCLGMAVDFTTTKVVKSNTDAVTHAIIGKKGIGGYLGPAMVWVDNYFKSQPSGYTLRHLTIPNTKGGFEPWHFSVDGS